jgi:hypothetical protein
VSAAAAGSNVPRWAVEVAFEDEYAAPDATPDTDAAANGVSRHGDERGTGNREAGYPRRASAGGGKSSLGRDEVDVVNADGSRR